MEARVTQPTTIQVPHSHNRRVMLGAALFFLTAPILILMMQVPGIADVLSIQPHVYGLIFELTAAGLGVWLVILMLWWARRRGKFDLFEPPVWLSLNMYLQVVLNVWLLQRDKYAYIPWVRENYATVIPAAVVLFGVALTILWGAYAWAYNRLSNGPVKLAASRMHLQAVMLIWVMGWIVGIISVVIGTSSYLGAAGSVWQNYIAFVAIITDAATAALVIYQFRRPSTIGWVWLGVVVLTDIGLPLVAGSKSFALSLLWLAIYIYYATNRLPKRWLAVGFVVVVLLVPVVNQFRDILWKVGESQAASFTGRLESLADAMSATLSQPVSSAFEDTRQTFEHRQGNMLDLTASVLYLTPSQLPYVGSEMAQYFFQQIIPRVIWLDKPTARPQIFYITSTYGSAPSEYAFSEIGLAADSYRAGGLPTVAIWFVFMGLFSAWLYHHGIVRGGTAGIVFYVTVLVHIIRYEADITTTSIYLIGFGPLIWLIVTRIMFTPETTEQPKLASSAQVARIVTLE